MTHDDDNSDKELDSLLNREGRKNKPGRNQPPATAGGPQPSLDELLDGVSTPENDKTVKTGHANRKRVNDANVALDSVLSAYNSKPSARSAGSDTPAHAPAADLEQLLENTQSGPASDSSPRIKAGAHQPAGASPPGLDQLLESTDSKPAGEISPRKAGSEQPTAAPATDLDHHLESSAGSKRSRKERTGSSNISGTKLGWAMIAGLVVAVVFFILPLQEEQPVGVEQNNSQGTLNALVSDIEQYIEQNSVLPDNLEGFPSFPAAAVSWPISSWNVRNIQGKTEIFWLPEPDMSFAVMVRDSSGTWLYDYSGQTVFLPEDGTVSSGSR